MMDPKTAELLDRLANALGVGTETVWSALLKQAPISAAIDLLMFVLSAALLTWGVRHFLGTTTKEKFDELIDDYGPLVVVVLAVPFILVLVMAVLFLYGALTGFLNPEYWAVDQILDALKGDS